MYIDPIDTTTHLFSTVAEEKKYRKLQYEAEWNESSDSVFYKRQANYFKNLILQGVLYDPKF